SIITVVWFSVILNLTRDAFIEIANISLEHALLSWGVTLLMAIIFVIPAYKTIKWIAYVDYIAAPAIVFILLATVWGALDVGGGIRAIIEKAPVASGTIFIVFTSSSGGSFPVHTLLS